MSMLESWHCTAWLGPDGHGVAWRGEAWQGSYLSATKGQGNNVIRCAPPLRRGFFTPKRPYRITPIRCRYKGYPSITSP
jgi:hypothetical protein